jgi:plasmid stabilization system protein ParE
MARPRFTLDACRDLEEITRYTGARDASAAARLTDRLEAICWRLARDPGIGQPSIFPRGQLPDFLPRE